MRVTLFTQPWQSIPSTFSSTVCIGSGRILPQEGKMQGEGAALAHGALHRQAAAVQLDDLARDGEADAGAGEAAGDVRAALEAREDALEVRRRDADAAVLDAEQDFGRPRLQPHAHLAPFGRVLDGVGD